MGKRRKRKDPSDLEAVLVAAIRRSGLSLRTVAALSGVSTPQVTRFIKGERTLTLPAASKLARFLALGLRPLRRRRRSWRSTLGSC